MTVRSVRTVGKVGTVTTVSTVTTVTTVTTVWIVTTRASAENFLGQTMAKISQNPFKKSSKMLKYCAKNRSPVMPLISKIETSSPTARLGDLHAALGPAADMTLEHLFVNMLQTAKKAGGMNFGRFPEFPQIGRNLSPSRKSAISGGSVYNSYDR